MNRATSDELFGLLFTYLLVWSAVDFVNHTELQFTLLNKG